MITGAVVIDLAGEWDDTRDRRATGYLSAIPDGCRVVLRVGDREFAPPTPVDWLCKHADRLHYEVLGDSPEAVAAWVKALRHANPWGPIV